MNDITSLAARRADKAGDSRLWTPRDALEDLLRKIDAGEAKPNQLVIHYMEGEPNDGQTHHYSVANVTRPQHIAILALAQSRALLDWLK